MIGWPIILLYLCIYTYVQRQAVVRVYLHIKKKYERKGSARGFTVEHVIQAQNALQEIFSYHSAGICKTPTSLEL